MSISVSLDESIKNELNIIFSKIRQCSVNIAIQILPKVGDKREDILNRVSINSKYISRFIKWNIRQPPPSPLWKAFVKGGRKRKKKNNKRIIIHRF